MSSGAASVEFREIAIQPCASKTFAGDIALPLARLPGEPFPVLYDFFCICNGGVADVGAVFSFAGLPAGYSIVSCQGYEGQPVPTLPMSWGRLKQAYR